MDVLNDHIANTTIQTETFAPDDTPGADADDGLVAGHLQGCSRSIPVRARLPSTRVASGLNRELALRRPAGAFGRPVITAALSRSAAFCLYEVKCSIQHDDARRAVAQV